VERLGFDDDKAERVSDMLRWQDVHKQGPSRNS
jgi:hypothetical protein